MMKVFAVLLSTLVCAVSSAAFAAPLQVAVSIQPQKYFVEKIGGADVAVMVMLAPGADMHTYEPKPRQMAGLAGTAVYFAVGADFERVWLEKITTGVRSMRVVRLDEHLRKLPMQAHDHDHHAHHHCDPAEGFSDPHVWLSPPNVRIMAETIRDSLIEINPARSDTYRSNYSAFAAEISRLDSELSGLFQNVPAGSRRFMVYHPAWGYFAATYGLSQVPVEAQGKEPGPQDMMRIVRQARQDGIRVIFVQPQLSDRSARTIADEIGARIVVADPLAYDWTDNLRRVAREFAGALQ
jgi:zinc transport system substrate-binding protein